MTITIDNTKGWAVPKNAAEWTELLAGTGLPNPSHAWPCQVASGNVLDVVGSLDLVATGTGMNYTQVASGWASRSISVNDGSGARFVESTTDPNTTSMVWLFVISQEAAPAAGRVIGGIHVTASTSSFRLQWTNSGGGGTDPLLRAVTPGGGTNGTVTHPPASYVLSLRSDLSAGVRRVSSGLDSVSGSPGGTFTADNMGFPGSSADGNMRYLYVARWDGVAAEALDDTAIATIRSRIKNPPVTVTVDATKGWAVPGNKAEWDLLLSGSGLPSPDSAWPCQEASGNLADVIGTLTLTAANTPLYQQAAAGWSRNGVGATDNTTGRFTATSGSGPNPSTTSQVWMFVVVLPGVVPAARLMGGINTTFASNACRLFWQTTVGTTRLQITCAASNTVGSVHHPAGSYVIFLRYDRAVSVARAYTDLETISTAFSTSVNDGQKGLGASAAWGGLVCQYMALWKGANAEALNDTAVATVRGLIEGPAAPSPKGHYYRRLLRQMGSAA